MLNEEPLHQATLADMMDMEPITLSRQVDRMEAAGLIERRPDPGDRRIKRLYLTEAARPLVDKFRSVASSCYDNVLDRRSPSEEVELVVGILTGCAPTWSILATSRPTTIPRRPRMSTRLATEKAHFMSADGGSPNASAARSVRRTRAGVPPTPTAKPRRNIRRYLIMASVPARC